MSDWPSTCPLCGSKLGEHHAKDCKHWGQVVPSEVPGLLELAMAEVLSKRETPPRTTSAPTDGGSPP